MRRLLLSVVVLLAVCGNARGDTWVTSDEPWSVSSASGEWKLVVALITANPAYSSATLHRRNATGVWRQTASWRLVNHYAPMRALVANDGTTVTFDNWTSYGLGENIVVIYRPDGTLVRTMALADFLVEEDIAVFSRSVSSLWWSGTHRIEEPHRLILQVKGPKGIEELPVSLETGELLTPKKRHFPGLPRLVPSVALAFDPDDQPAGRPCQGGVAVSGQELLSRAAAPALPSYPPVALKARIQGTVLLGIAVAEDGAVQQVEIRKPLPFGLDTAAEAAARTWHFRPFEREGRPIPMCGRVVVNFVLTLTDPPPLE
jgi:TonB family protein